MVSLKSVEYKGFENCLELSNDKVELIISASFGPRVLVYRRKDNGVNFMKNFDDHIENFSQDSWQSYGGHRLWIAPEVHPRTYYPDVEAVTYDFDGKTLHMVCATETTTKMQKEFFITLAEDDTTVEIKQRVYNRNIWPIEFAPWSLTVMAENGRLIVPQEPYVPHGENEGESFEHARPLILWQFTKMGDPRFTWGDKFVQMRQDDKYESKQKIGMTNKLGYALYSLEKELFIKRFDYEDGAVYADGGCNCEFFTMPGFLEIESLAPLKVVAVDDYAELNESWSIYDIDLSTNDDEIEKQIADII